MPERYAFLQDTGWGNGAPGTNLTRDHLDEYLADLYKFHGDELGEVETAKQPPHAQKQSS